MTQTEFPCENCGALVAWDPTAQAITCGYCGTANAVPQTEGDIRELDFHAWLQAHQDEVTTVEETVYKCSSCGAESAVSFHTTAALCAFCGTPIVTQGHSQRHIRPSSLLPFAIAREQALVRFRHWIGRQWFAPNDLKTYARPEKNRLQGVYLPHWTFDCRTTTWYTGQRGEAYYVTVTSRNSDGSTSSQQERRIRWYPASGIVWNLFDDVMVPASRSLPGPMVERLEPWDLEALTPYHDGYLAGFVAESYQVGLEEGFGRAKERMEPQIDAAIRADIGGDEQRIHTKRIQYDGITFKHILLPLWICSYRYRDRIFRFVVNARTGEVFGERPYSWIKITLAVLAVLILLYVWIVYGEGDQVLAEVGGTLLLDFLLSGGSIE